MTSERCSNFILETIADCKKKLVFGKRLRTMLIFDENLFERVNIVVYDFLSEIIDSFFDSFNNLIFLNFLLSHKGFWANNDTKIFLS